MPKAFGQKHHYKDHDSDTVDVTPPVQNQWYTVMESHDCRLLWCTVYQINDAIAAADLRVRWTVDGNVYLGAISAAYGTTYYVYRSVSPSAGGTSGLAIVADVSNAAKWTDKRGIDFKVEVRQISAVGAGARLVARTVRENLELT